MQSIFPQVSRAELAAHRRLIRSAMALAALSALLAAGFYSLSRAVEAGITADVDRDILLAMRVPGDPSDPIGPRWLEEVGRDVTALGGVTVLTLLIATVTAFFWLAAMRRAAVYVAVASLGAFLVSVGLKHVFERPRPELTPHGVAVYTYSFPSGHSTMSAAVYLTLGMVASRFVKRRRLKVLLVGVAMLVTATVGVSRVYLGVHWPTDVLAGWAVGFSWALVCWCAATWLQDRGMVEPEVDPAPSDKSRRHDAGG
jgi:undecaprenyl-diphosphatase